MRKLLCGVLLLGMCQQGQAQQRDQNMELFNGIVHGILYWSEEVARRKGRLERELAKEAWFETQEGQKHKEKMQRHQAYQAVLQKAEQGDVKSQSAMGAMHWKGWEDIVTKDPETAVEWFKKAAAGGSLEVQRLLGGMYYKGENSIPQNKPEALKYWRMAARQGDEQVQPVLASMLYAGDGVPKNYKESLQWFAAVGGRGDPVAQHQTGSMIHHGEGVAADKAAAMPWYTLAAEQGYIKSQFMLGLLALEAWNVEEAKRWLLAASQANHRDAQAALGMLCQMEGNAHEANAWFLKSAHNGNADAQFYIGSIQEDQRFKFWKRAAEQGQAEAMHNLAILYTFGRGGATQDFLAAHVWFNLASAHRVSEDKRKESAGERDRLLTHLTEGQRDRSQQMVSSWQPKPEPAQELGMGQAVKKQSVKEFVAEKKDAVKKVLPRKGGKS